MKYEDLKFLRSFTEFGLADIALRLAAHDWNLFVALSNNDNLIRVKIYDADYTISREQIDTMLRDGVPLRGSQKVAVIKVARMMFDLGLKEAKDLVEELAAIGVLPYDWKRSDHNNNYASCVTVVFQPSKF